MTACGWSLRVLVAIFTFVSTTAPSFAFDASSCLSALEKLQRESRDSVDSAQQAESECSECEDCRDDDREDCSSECSSCRSATDSLQFGLMGIETAVRSVQLSCNYPFEMDHQRGLEKMQRRLKEFESKTGRQPQSAPPPVAAARPPLPDPPPSSAVRPPPALTYRGGASNQAIARMEAGGAVVVLSDASRWAIGAGQAGFVASWERGPVTIRGPRILGRIEVFDLVNVATRDYVPVQFMGYAR